MMTYRLRTPLALVLAALLCGIGFWFGEEGGPVWATLPILTGVAGCIVVGLTVSGRAWKKVSAGSAAIALYALAFFAGLTSFDHAFAECTERGEEVRVSLVKHHQAKHAYPETLNDLGDSLPCGLLSGASILKYERTKSGYTLSFGDWLVEHTATESEPFTAHK